MMAKYIGLRLIGLLPTAFVITLLSFSIVQMKKNIMGYQVSVGTWQLYRGLEKAYVQ